MNPQLSQFLKYVLLENLVFVSFLGTLLVLSESERGPRTAAVSGAKFVACLVPASFLGWAFSVALPAELSFVAFFLFLVVGLAAVQVLRNWGELEGSWLGLPREIIALPLFVGSQVWLQMKGLEFAGAVIAAAGAGAAFYLAFVMIAAVREQLELAETPAGLQKLGVVVVSMGVVAMALLGFKFF